MKRLWLSFLFLPSLASALTLQEATDFASANSHELKIAALEARSADAGHDKAMSAFLPKVDLVARHLFTERFEELEIEFGGGTFVMPAIQPYSLLGLQLRWDLFNGFASVNQLSAADLARQAAEKRRERETQKLQAEIRSLFYRALGRQQLIDVAGQNVTTLREHLTDINRRVSSGVSTKFDVLRIEVQLEEAQTEKTQAEDDAAVARQRLFQRLGRQDDGQALQGKLPEDWSGIDLTMTDPARLRRADREAQVLKVEQDARTAAAAKAHWLPRVSAFASQDYYNNYNHAIWEEDERFKTSYEVGVSMSWNIFDGGASLASQRQAALAEAGQRERLALLDEAIPVEIDQSRRRLIYDIATYKNKISSIRKAEEAVRLAKSGLSAGIRTNTEVLDAVVDLNRAKATAVRAQIDAVEALGDLEMALGKPLGSALASEN